MNRRNARIIVQPRARGAAVGSIATLAAYSTGYKPFILGLSYLGGGDHIGSGGLFTLGVSYIGGGDRLDAGEQFRPWILGATVLGDLRAHL